MTFENEFFKDFLTKQFLDLDDEENYESDGTAYVRLKSVNVQHLDVDDASLLRQIEHLKVEASVLQSQFFCGTCYGKWKMSIYTRLSMLMTLGQLIVRVCRVAALLNCFDLVKFIRDAEVERKER